MTSSREMPTLAELLAERDTLVLSPHMDDAMLSASAIVLDHPSDVWTVFTAAPHPAQTTSWDLSCGFPDSDATIAARKLEDAEAFAGTPARTRHLDQLEGAYATREQHRAALPAVEADIDAWMSAHPEGVVVAPACAGLQMPPPIWAPALTAARKAKIALRARSSAAGAPPAPPSAREAAEATSIGSARVEPVGPTAPAQNLSAAPASAPQRVVGAVIGRAKGVAQKALHAEHLWRRRRTMGEDGLAANPDHLALRDLTLAVAARHPSVQVVLFEDLPYLWHARGDKEVARIEKSTGFAARRVSLPVDRQRKHAHLAHYVSQLPVLDQQGRLLGPATLPDHEVYWIIEQR